MSKITLLIFFIIASNTVYSQALIIDDDERISRNLDTLVSFLRKNTIGDRVINNVHEIDTSRHNLYIVKRLELYNSNGGLLLIKFGLMGSQPFEFWALISGENHMLYIFKGEDLIVPTNLASKPDEMRVIIEYYQKFRKNFGCIYC